MGDTWGISGPAFLLAYVVLAVIVLIAVGRARHTVGSRRGEPVTGITTRPHDVAYLNGGAELAVVSALTALRLRGAISSERGNARSVPHADPGSDELERAVYAAIETPTHRKRVPTHPWVAAVLAGIETRLIDAGLLLSAAQRRRVRGFGWWMVAVACLGVVRLLAGLAGGKPVGLLVFVLVVVVLIAVKLLVSTPQPTGLGSRTMAALRKDHHTLDPSEHPDWGLYGPVGAALGIGLFGASAVWASDPAIAGELAVQRISTSGSDGSSGSSGGDSGGGCGGGGCGGGCGG